jgi:hypothetical protein
LEGQRPENNPSAFEGILELFGGLWVVFDVGTMLLYKAGIAHVVPVE